MRRAGVPVRRGHLDTDVQVPCRYTGRRWQCAWSDTCTSQWHQGAPVPGMPEESRGASSACRTCPTPLWVAALSLRAGKGTFLLSRCAQVGVFCQGTQALASLETNLRGGPSSETMGGQLPARREDETPAPQNDPGLGPWSLWKVEGKTSRRQRC